MNEHIVPTLIYGTLALIGLTRVAQATEITVIMKVILSATIITSACSGVGIQCTCEGTTAKKVSQICGAVSITIFIVAYLCTRIF